MSTTPTPPSRFSLQWSLYGANVLTVLSKAAAIMVAKTFNAAITQSFNPDTACSESPKGTWAGFFSQLAFVFVTALLVLRVWYRHAHAQLLKDQHSSFWSKTWDVRKFEAGEVLGWATKELTAIAVALLSAGLGYERPEDKDKDDGRLLRDAMQGDSPLTGVIENDWKQVAAYAIYACIMAIVAFSFFVLGMKHLQTLVSHYYKLQRLTLLFRFSRKDRDNVSQQVLEKEQTDDLAVELATESTKVSQAYTLNGTFSGIIAVAIFSTNNGDPDQFTWGGLGILEVYTIVLLYFGGFIFSRRCSRCSNLEFLQPLVDFYKDVWGCLAGLALGSIATSPGGILSGLDLEEHMDGTAADAVRATLVSCLALVFLFHGAHIRVYESFCYCTPHFDQKMAHQTAEFFITASSLAFAWAWEDFSNDVVCEELPKAGINEVGAVWINFAIMAAIMIPTSVFFSLRAQKAMVLVQRDLDALSGKETTKEDRAPQLESSAIRDSDDHDEFFTEPVEGVDTVAGM